ncbi:Lrp/AsnC family transcriptional regulator [[Clostridium] polysaccharolyticum]|uniref:DNA-binding transcriptional regulator, Lrp family n=1 Tax=[Clostridium] polysaccharolyticum TaxID=29364 RepID=A0A1I0E8B6_9FIRM|nr:Lrp/AsnC family transcriptional regulator [[Clostridium] polysaccharolyticum]SET41423.1 DNA-binding transcriptional regulator, Lrp family [[Clostridium] polysaccharolyticum]
MRNSILRILDKNSKVSLEDLAVMIDAPVDKVRLEITKMEEEGVICGYPTLINWDKTDFEKVTAWIEVKVTPQRGRGFEKIAERIYRFDEVESVYLMSGTFDLAVLIEGRTMREVADFVSSKLAPLESVLSTSTNFVLKKYKEHGLELVSKRREDERMLYTP